MVAAIEPHKRKKENCTTDLRGAPSPMITVGQVAVMLACSAKTVYRLTDRGAIPKPIRLGGMIRWRRTDIEQWIADRCPRSSSG